MIFNSVEFAFFLPIIFFLYWLLKRHLKLQNLLVLIASYIFYGWWDWRFLTLIFFSTFSDYVIGRLMTITSIARQKKILLWFSIIINIGILCYFKYFNFFLENFYNLFGILQSDLKFNSLDIILPVGISFYTFQTLSYTIDIYRGNLKAEKDFIAFAAFVSFFPQLVAGPIERATNLLPQFRINRKFDYSMAVDGLRQILWGLFKKIVIADNCAIYANQIFNNHDDFNGSTLLLGAIFFAFQIYGDFSGYSDIAIGTSKLFGINLMRNFAFPYFSRDIAEFWRRWHISLSTWFRDYLYIPLGGSKGNLMMKIRNTFIIFIVSGFWHGAKWTFVIWGALNALFFLPLLLVNKNRKNLGSVHLKSIGSIVLTFLLVVIAWIFFRSENLVQAWDIITTIFSERLFELPSFSVLLAAVNLIVLILILIGIEWYGRESEFGFDGLIKSKKIGFRYLSYFLIIISIIWFGADNQDFIYFQF